MDREKVIKGLECCKNGNCDTVNTECPYKFTKGGDCIEAVCADALALLKEQEAVEPIPPTDESDLWKCGNCNHQLFRAVREKYCPNCGRAVKWDDI